MSAITFLGNSTMIPSHCILRAFTRVSPSKYIRDTVFRSCPSRFSSFRNQNNIPDSNRIIKPTNAGPFFTDRQSSVTAQVVSEARSLSASTTLDQIYTKNGLNVKPLDVERLEGDEKDGEVINGDDKSVNGDGFEGIKRNEAEEEAWRLLRESVVTYCDSPVGTMAAKDPTDITTSNYDQVFIRDFVPSALAFLLNGESDIVRNFLLHTLQLQVLIPIYNVKSEEFAFKSKI